MLGAVVSYAHRSVPSGKGPTTDSTVVDGEVVVPESSPVVDPVGGEVVVPESSFAVGGEVVRPESSFELGRPPTHPTITIAAAARMWTSGPLYPTFDRIGEVAYPVPRMISTPGSSSVVGASIFQPRSRVGY